MLVLGGVLVLAPSTLCCLCVNFSKHALLYVYIWLDTIISFQAR